jgi:cyclase
MDHFVDVFRTSQVDGALAASVFHSAEIDIGVLKDHLLKHAITMRI